MSNKRRQRDSTFITHHVPHGIPLKTELLLKVEENVFYLLLGERDHTFGAPSGIRLTAANVLRGPEVAQIWCRSAPTIERLCRGIHALSVNVMIGVGICVAWKHEVVKCLA